MRETIFRTGGDWDSTTLHVNGVELPADRLLVELRAGEEDYDGEPSAGGVRRGADLSAYVIPSEDPDGAQDLLPGRIQLEFPGYSVVVENLHPEVHAAQTRVWLSGREITDRVVDVLIDVNALEDDVRAYVTEYKDRFLLRDEVITHTIL